MTRVLITGVSGFIGRNLLAYLQSFPEVIEVIGHSRKFNRDDLAVPFVSEISKKTINENNIDVIVHLAGIAHDLSGAYQEEDYYQVNYRATVSCFDEFVKSNAHNFIFISSIKAAVDICSTPATEKMEAQPATPYGKSKRAAEVHLMTTPRKEHQRVVIIRPAMVHGPGNKGNLNLLYKAVKRGIPFPFGAFHNQRSFLSIDNLVYALKVFILEIKPSGIYHAADDGYLSTRDLYLLIATIISVRGKVWVIPKGLLHFIFTIIGKRRMLQKLTENLVVSNEKIKQVIGPLPVTLQAGLVKTFQSFEAK